ncbi:hypothetical protein K435DRAFT_812072 [Dendrothele bispora CBS 962.96]|uniref:Uncharacterized protein n=1 Tax=Dendrothele bispora (strain CBS 962.96) TaxID=1314807 RepID=A0A4S8KR91_DENBC|nr:hypothetical protein K435DRAFT_812072 [Dendrothele bispora CBS 962.96]
MHLLYLLFLAVAAACPLEKQDTKTTSPGEFAGSCGPISSMNQIYSTYNFARKDGHGYASTAGLDEEIKRQPEEIHLTQPLLGKNDCRTLIAVQIVELYVRNESFVLHEELM